ncbi:hypothetical protein DFH06DRAFT_1341666 [Mycena polygramma]|nr:hypothetical protein DFH06DRAFT_1341666 [Mycena polygramma]
MLLDATVVQHRLAAFLHDAYLPADAGILNLRPYSIDRDKRQPFTHKTRFFDKLPNPRSAPLHPRFVFRQQQEGMQPESPARDRDDKMRTSYHLGPYFGYKVEEIAVREVKDSRSPYREIAVVQFRDIRNAIRAHARIRAGPFIQRVHVAYGTDKFEIPSGKPGPAAPSAVDTSLTNESLRYPTYLPVDEAHRSHRPFTTIKLSNLAPETTLRDLCKRIYGAPTYAIDLHTDGGDLHARGCRTRLLYSDAKTHALTIHGRPLFTEPGLGVEAAVAAHPSGCSRAISVTATNLRA